MLQIDRKVGLLERIPTMDIGHAFKMLDYNLFWTEIDENCQYFLDVAKDMWQSKKKHKGKKRLIVEWTSSGKRTLSKKMKENMTNAKKINKQFEASLSGFSHHVLLSVSWINVCFTFQLVYVCAVYIYHWLILWWTIVSIGNNTITVIQFNSIQFNWFVSIFNACMACVYLHSFRFVAQLNRQMEISAMVSSIFAWQNVWPHIEYTNLCQIDCWVSFSILWWLIFNRLVHEPRSKKKEEKQFNSIQCNLCFFFRSFFCDIFFALIAGICQNHLFVCLFRIVFQMFTVHSNSLIYEVLYVWMCWLYTQIKWIVILQK